MPGFMRFFLVSALVFSAGCSLHPGTISPCAVSSAWYDRNSHLIPSDQEKLSISFLDFDQDGIENRSDPDLDGDGIADAKDKDRDNDGIMNRFDPAPDDPREHGYNPFGMLAFLTWDHDWNHYKYGSSEDLEKAVSLIAESGCGFVRIDFYWGDIEPEQGKFVFDKFDRIVDLLAEYNIGILGILDYSAPWAAAQWNDPPADFKTYADFCRKVVSRYKHRVKYWEVWNEPDSPFYWTVQDNMQTYTELLKQAYSAIKETDPSSRVLLGGFTQGGYYALQDLYRRGGKDYFDIMNIHPFVDPFDPEGVQSIHCLYSNIKKLMSRYNDGDKKIWFTEIGCPGLDSRSKYFNWWMGPGPEEKEQAGFLAEVYRELLGLDAVEKVFWAFFRDNQDHFKSAVDYFGILRWDFSLKPAYRAYKKAVREWRKRVNSGFDK